LLAQNTTELFSDGSSNILLVYFDQPVQIDPDVFYTASVLLDGLELSYFGQEGMTDVTVGSVSFQFQCSSESTNGTGVQGGQIPELIFYGPNVAKDNNSGSAN
jgi:BTB/POZ domain-containing protein 3/6